MNGPEPGLGNYEMEVSGCGRGGLWGLHGASRWAWVVLGQPLEVSDGDGWGAPGADGLIFYNVLRGESIFFCLRIGLSDETI